MFGTNQGLKFCTQICSFSVHLLGAQDISQSLTSAGLAPSSNGKHEMALTINNANLSQVLAQATNVTCPNATGAPQEITLTISGLY